MSKEITFDKGSKRRLDQIRWKLVELFSLALLAIFIFAVSLLIMLWEVQRVHPRQDPTKVPELRNADPAEP